MFKDSTTEQAAQAARASHGPDWRLNEQLSKRRDRITREYPYTHVDLYHAACAAGTPGL